MFPAKPFQILLVSFLCALDCTADVGTDISLRCLPIESFQKRTRKFLPSRKGRGEESSKWGGECLKRLKFLYTVQRGGEGCFFLFVIFFVRGMDLFFLNN